MIRFAFPINKNLPNLLTALRVLLTGALNFYIYNHFGNLVIPFVIFSVICLTDYFDGKIARFTENTSRFGAVFDVLADLFYIVVSYSLLCYFRMLPLWFLYIIMFKFTEFICTSYFLKRFHGERHVFVFDIIGRIVAVFFYILPMLAYISFQLSSYMYLFVIKVLIYIVTFMVIISSSFRLSNCIKTVKTLYWGSMRKGIR